MPKLSDLKLSRFTLLQTAASGHGKTTRTLSATRFGKVYIFDFDGKASGAGRQAPEALNLREGWQDMVEADDYSFQPFEAAIAKVKELIALKDKMPYATIVIDTFTNLNEKIYIKAMGAKLERNVKADFEEWGKIDNDMVYFFGLLKQLPCNLIINCHISETEDEVSKRTKYGQSGRGGYRNKLSAFCTDSHYLLLDLNKYQVKVKNSETLPVNTNIPAKFIDKNGMATVFDLSIFDEYAYRKDSK